MNDDEMRIDIARLKGWTNLVTLQSGRIVGTSPAGRFYATLPNWPGSIADAWELVEEMRVAGHRVELIFFPPKPKEEVPAGQYCYVSEDRFHMAIYRKGDILFNDENILVAICAQRGWHGSGANNGQRGI